MINLYKGDFRDWLPSQEHFKMLIADIPDNNGLDYNGYDDNLPDSMYTNLLKYVLDSSAYCDILWISYNAKHIALMGHLLHEGFYREEDFTVRHFVQYVSFGYNSQTDFSYCFRPLLRVMRKDVETYPDAIRIQSDRQKAGDKRANPNGKIPPDVWAIHRVNGNSGQRRSWHPTQLNGALYERCIDFSCESGDRVGDLFAGTGTLARAAEGKGLDVSLFEISPFYCEKMAEEFDITPKVR